MFQAQTLTVSKLRLIRREHKSRQEILRVSLDCLLTRHLLDTTAEVQDFETLWRWTCNCDRPNMALVGIAPLRE